MKHYQGYDDGLIGSRIRALDSYQSLGWPWMAVTHSCRKDAFYGAPKKPWI